MGPLPPTITGSPIQTPASPPNRGDRLSGSHWEIFWDRPNAKTLLGWPGTRAILQLPTDMDWERGYWRLPGRINWPWLELNPPDTSAKDFWMGLIGTQIVGQWRPRVILAFPSWMMKRLYHHNPALPHLLAPRITRAWIRGPRQFSLYLPLPSGMEPPNA